MPQDPPGVSEDPAADFEFFDEIDEDLDEDDERAIAEAEQAILEGRVFSHEAIMRWVRSWGTENELPPPECGE